jgi:hypothetical protein
MPAFAAYAVDVLAGVGAAVGPHLRTLLGTRISARAILTHGRALRFGLPEGGLRCVHYRCGLSQEP